MRRVSVRVDLPPTYRAGTTPLQDTMKEEWIPHFGAYIRFRGITHNGLEIVGLKQPESKLQLKIRKTLEKEVGGWWRKIHVSEFQSAGIPDLIGCVQGKFYAFEVKMPGNPPSILQATILNKIRLQGGVAEVVTTPQEAVRIVRETLALSKAGRRPRS